MRPFRIYVAAASVLAFGVLPVTALGADGPSFVDESATSGIASTYDGDWEFTVGGGAAAFDCNADGFEDLLLAGGASPATFYRNASSAGGPLSFVPEQSGLEIDSVTGTYPIDIDADGNMDVVLLRIGENLVMRGEGACRFTRANELWGFDGGDAWSTAFAATWEMGAAWPTLAIGNYIDRYEDISPWGSCTDNWLHRPADAGPGFAAPVALTPSYCALSMLFTDWNRSGTPSLRVSNDREYYKGGEEQLWHVMPSEAPRPYSRDEGWQRLRIWGMGIASYDLDADFYPEYFLTSMADHKLQKLMGSEGGTLMPHYADTAYASNTTVQQPYAGGEVKPSTGWHAAFEDVDNDGLADLFVAKGNVDRMPDFALADPNNLLMQQPDGTFVEMGDTAGIASLKTARGGALADLNLDGLVDLVVVNRREPAEIWRNVTQGAGNWIELALAQDGPNRLGIGAWIEIRAGEREIRREITLGGGHASGKAGWHHFGLGLADAAEVRVIWPDGAVSDWQALDANGCYILSPGEAATPWMAAR
ncbi:MAG: CRTAC1 family protein [Alphaproteobacteria bacterium]|nr:CRTAC1 family protein [Alphaproteobacteria bacterium]